MNPVCAGPVPVRASPEPLSLGRAQRARGLGFTNRPRVRDDVRPTDAAATEERVADQPIELEAILGERFTVLSGYRAPGSRSTFDHVVVGPAGVFVVLRFDEAGRVRGAFCATGHPPHFAERLATAGCRLNPALFESRLEV